jgi:hypothetical protein
LKRKGERYEKKVFLVVWSLFSMVIGADLAYDHWKYINSPSGELEINSAVYEKIAEVSGESAAFRWRSGEEVQTGIENGVWFAKTMEVPFVFFVFSGVVFLIGVILFRLFLLGIS